MAIWGEREQRREAYTSRVRILPTSIHELCALRERISPVFQQLIRNTQEGYWLIDAAGATLDVNPAMCRICWGGSGLGSVITARWSG